MSKYEHKYYLHVRYNRDNLYNMMEYICDVDDWDLRSDRKDKNNERRTFLTADEFIAQQFLNRVKMLLNHGLNKDYVHRQDNISTIRGNIDITATMLNSVNGSNLISCVYDELSEDSLLNRIIKTAAFMLIRKDKDEVECKNKLKQQMKYFAEVNELTPYEINRIDWDVLQFSYRNNKIYKKILQICHIIIDRDKLCINRVPQGENNSKQTDRGNEFMLELYWIFEKFVFSYYQREYPQLTVEAETLHWDKKARYIPYMKTDITLTDKNNKNVLIIDTKCYNKILNTNDESGRTTFSPKHINQIFAYVCNKKVRNNDGIVNGLLLYAETDEKFEYSSDNILYKGILCGYNISVYTINLSETFDDIKKQLDNIVEDYFKFKQV